jgi:Uma2 family endonuclease
MATETVTAPVTLEQFLEIERNAPDDVRLELIEGEIREYPGMTTRNANHSEAISFIAAELVSWLRKQPDRIGTVASGEARCRLKTGPDTETIVGLDVAYFEGEQHVRRPKGQSFFDGPPVVAVEVLSGSDTQEAIVERVELLLTAGIRQVWVADPNFRTVMVHRPDAEPAGYSASKELPGEPDLPGFRCRVGRLFAR